MLSVRDRNTGVSITQTNSDGTGFALGLLTTPTPIFLEAGSKIVGTSMAAAGPIRGLKAQPQIQNPALMTLKFEAKVVAKHVSKLADDCDNPTANANQMEAIIMQMQQNEISEITERLYKAGQESDRLNVLFHTQLQNGPLKEAGPKLREIATEISRLADQL